LVSLKVPDASTVKRNENQLFFITIGSSRKNRDFSKTLKRKIAAGEKCGGGKSYAEARPGDVELGRQLRRPDPDRRPISLRCFCRTRLCRVNRQAIRSCGHRVYRTDASHDLARRQMPVTDQPLAAVSVSLSA
jgi:hypothetical protein